MHNRTRDTGLAGGEVIEAFYTKVEKSLYIDLPIWNTLHVKNLITVWLKVVTGTSANVMSIKVFEVTTQNQFLQCSVHMEIQLFSFHFIRHLV